MERERERDREGGRWEERRERREGMKPQSREWKNVLPITYLPVC
tara:strand:+ start:429 stop:560 length:132 start_codon:yes stop_codon:yes gene_type:complete